MNRRVVYTSIFGGYDTLIEPKNISPNIDYICFTDANVKSDVWQIIKVPAIYTDPTRCARKYKLLPHRFLNQYDCSLWVDGNITVHGDVNKFIDTYLPFTNIAVYDHMQCFDKRNCIYQEAQTIFYFGQKNGNYKDDPNIIQQQMERYTKDSYPQNNGLVSSGVILRNHNSTDVIKSMEYWWSEVKYGSKRDQLSFNYSAWKTGLNFKWINGDIRANEYVRLIGKHAAKDKSKQFAPINAEYFLNMELANGGGGKEIIKQQGKLITVRDIVNFFKDTENLDTVKSTLEPSNWQYFNCMLGQFRHGVGDHHDLGWENMTKEYYESLDLMTDKQIESFLKNNPVEFDNGFIRHNYHRACAMIGRLISGKPYIPFYMKTSQIYDEPRKHDGKHRIKPLTTNVYGIQEVLNLGIPASEFTITQSGILALMGIRENDDIDIIISSKIRDKVFNGNKGFIRLDNGIEIFEEGKSKFMHFGATNEDDLINKFSFNVGGINFLEPRFYFRKKRKDRDKDKRDWKGVWEFVDMDGEKGYPWNQLNKDQWGL